MATAYVQKLRLFSRDVRLYLITTALTGLTVYSGVQPMLLNLYLLRLRYGPEFIGLANAVGGVGFSIWCLPAGLLGTRWSSRRMMIAGVGLMVVGSGLLPLAEFGPTAWQSGWLFTTFVLARVGLALYFVNGIPFLMSATGPEERDHAFSAQMALEPLAGFIGSLIGGLLPGLFAALLGVPLENPAPYRYPLLLAALLLAPALLALLTTRDIGVRRVQEHVVEVGPAPYGLIALIVLVVALRFGGYMAAATFFNLYLDAELHVATSLIGTLKAAGQLLSVPAALVTPLLVARWGNSRVIALGSLGLALSMLPLALIPHWAAAGLSSMGMSALFAMTTAPIRVFSQELVSPGWRADMSGAFMMAAGLSASVMAMAGGYVITALGYASLFSIGVASTTAGALLFWATFRVPRGELARASAPSEPRRLE